MAELTELAAERKRKLLEVAKDAIGTNRVGMGDDKKLQKETVPINVLDVDSILGGGFKRGRVAMVIGEESMGKTLFTQWVIAAFQKQGDVCGLIDPEKTYLEEWFKRTGVETDDLLVAQPSSTEQAFDLACAWSENGMGLIVMDSLAALTPKARAESSLEKQEFMGLGPRKISEGLNTFTNKNTDALLLCTNQLRSKIGIVYGSPDEIPGGKAQRYYSSYIIKVSRKGWIEEKDTRVGYNMKLFTQKNKLAPPFQEAIIPFMFSGIIDTVKGTVDLAFDLELIPRKGAWYTWEGKQYHGSDKLAQLFHDDVEQLAKLQELVKNGSPEEVALPTFE